MNDCSTTTISLLYCKCCTRILKKNEGMPDASPRFGIRKPILIVARFYHIHRSGAKIVAASGHLHVKNCTKIYLRRGSVPDLAGQDLQRSSRPPSWSGGASSQPLPKNPAPSRLFGPRSKALRASDLGPSGFDSAFALPWKKILRAPMLIGKTPWLKSE